MVTPIELAGKYFLKPSRTQPFSAHRKKLHQKSLDSQAAAGFSSSRGESFKGNQPLRDSQTLGWLHGTSSLRHCGNWQIPIPGPYKEILDA